MNLWIYILGSVVLTQGFLAYYVVSKFPMVKVFNINGVTLPVLYLAAVFFSPIIAPVILIVSFFGWFVGLFRKKVKPSDDIDELLRGFK